MVQKGLENELPLDMAKIYRHICISTTQCADEQSNKSVEDKDRTFTG